MTWPSIGDSDTGRDVSAMSGAETRCPYPFAWPDGLVQPKELLDSHRTPLQQVRLPSGDTAILASRYSDIRAILTDNRVSKSRNRPDIAKMTEHKERAFQWQVDTDPVAHIRMRRLIAKEFTAARVERLRPRIAAITDGLLDSMEQAGCPADLPSSFSFPFSIRVICELLGVPESDRSLFDNVKAPPWQYMQELIDRKRENPDDALISALIGVADQRDGRLSPQELVWWSTILLLAGYETTANQISGAMVLLFTHPDQLALLRSDCSLLPSAVEELLRAQIVGTSLSMLRYVTDDITVDGQVVPRGSSLIPSLECANHDPAVFSDPERVDITRTGNMQLTFSVGRHFCLGAALARTEMQIAIGGLLRRFPALGLAVDPAGLERSQDKFFQTFRSVPVQW